MRLDPRTPTGNRALGKNCLKESLKRSPKHSFSVKAK